MVWYRVRIRNSLVGLTVRERGVAELKIHLERDTRLGRIRIDSDSVFDVRFENVVVSVSPVWSAGEMMNFLYG